MPLCIGRKFRKCCVKWEAVLFRQMSFLACSENRPHPAVRNDNTLPLVVSRLMTARGARSLGQGALVAAFTLYLHALGWTAPEIGATLSAALLAGAVLTMAVGPLSDRRGRRRFLLIYEALQAGAALLALITAGPFAPLEQAWFAQALPAEKRGTIFSVNAAIGFIGMALGGAFSFSSGL